MYLSVLENIVIHLVVYVSDDERLRGRVRARKEGVVVGYIGHLADPIRVEV